MIISAHVIRINKKAQRGINRLGSIHSDADSEASD